MEEFHFIHTFSDSRNHRQYKIMIIYCPSFLPDIAMILLVLYHEYVTHALCSDHHTSDSGFSLSIAISQHSTYRVVFTLQSEVKLYCSVTLLIVLFHVVIWPYSPTYPIHAKTRKHIGRLMQKLPMLAIPILIQCCNFALHYI